jgi:SAM-dependent methyltransferase
MTGASLSPNRPIAPSINDIVEWDCANWGQCIGFWEEAVPLVPGATALAVGERNGGLSLWLASRGLHVHCTDLKGPAPQAQEIHRHFGVSDFVQYESANMLSLPYEDASMDVVAFKSVLGALGKYSAQEQALREVHRVLKPGGVLYMAENLQASPLHRWARNRFVAWAGYWRYISLGEIGELLTGFNVLRSRSFGFLGAFGRTEAQRGLLGMADRLVSPCVPTNWHYVVFLVGQKK